MKEGKEQNNKKDLYKMCYRFLTLFVGNVCLVTQNNVCVVYWHIGELSTYYNWIRYVFVIRNKKKKVRPLAAKHIFYC